MDSHVPIAIIGMACRFAGDVTSPESLWKMCVEGRSGWSEIPLSRFNLKGVYHPNPAKINTSNVRGGHFLTEDPALFDAKFFNLTAAVAATMDPQFRLQLESTYEAFESAGLSLQDVAGSKTSVFAGAFFRDYIEGHMRDPETLNRFMLMGHGAAMASNRISHFYDLRGPSMTIDTGCSTTLTAFHQACQSLRARECNMSIVGGANVMLNPDMFFTMSSLTLISPDGKSFAFDSRANGYGRGEGSATVILKRLDDALRDGDPIRAVIRETGANQDGKTETITTPSGSAQEELMRDCYLRAGLDPGETTYFEAHGTGTATGDPIEAKAIASVFKDHRPPGQPPLLLGSVKTNVGHTETASGLASIIKVTLALEKGYIPPSINFEKPNPELDLARWNIKVPTEAIPWAGKNGIRRASVNNFGYGGANAHVIMEDYASFLTSTRAPCIKESISNSLLPFANGNSNGDADGDHQEPISNGHANAHTKGCKEQLGETSRVFVLSGKDEQATLAMAINLQKFLETADLKDHGEQQSLFKNLAHTLGTRRTRFPWVSVLTAQSVPALVSVLETARIKPARITGVKPRLGFVFTGQGAQWWAMGRELIEAYPVFQASLTESDYILRDRYGSSWSLIEELLKDEATSKISEQHLSMPACVAIQLALVQLLESWGITPSAVTSHSSGEIASAYAAGAIEKTAALGIGYARGQFVATSRGGMVAVGLGVEGSNKYIARVLSGQLVAACMNSPTSTTVSGDVVAIEELERLLEADGIFARRLRVDTAYHSHHMAPYSEEYTAWILKNVDPEEQSSIVPGSKGRVADMNMDVVYSSPTVGQRITSAAEIRAPAHWAKSLVNPVRFVEAFQHMYFSTEDASLTESQPLADVDMIIEIGPHAALGGPIKEILSLPAFGGREVPYSSCLVRKNNAIETAHALVSELLRNGYPVDLDAVNFPHGRHGVKVMHALPHYPWSHQVRYWTEPRENKAHRERLEAPHDLLGSLAIGTNREAPSWKNLIDAEDLPWVRDHTLQGNVVYPGSGLICMAIEGALQACQVGARKILGYQLCDIDISQALVIPDAGNIETRLQLRPCSNNVIYAKGFKEFVIHSINSDNKWTEICKGLISVEFAEERAQSWSCSSKAPVLASELSDHEQPVKLEEYRMRVFPRELYANMRSVGINHGPVFQGLKTIRASNDQCVSILEIPDTAAIMPYHYQHDHIIHPATLDTVLQSAYPALPEPRSKMTEAWIPKSIKSLWISQGINNVPGHRFRSYTAVTYKDPRRVETRIVVCDDALGENPEQPPVIKLSGFEMHSMGNAISSPNEKQHEQEKFSVVKWVPDLDLMPPDRLKKQLSFPVPEGETEIIVELRQVCLKFVHDALVALTDADVAGLQGHFTKFYSWMQVQSQLAKQNKLGTQSCEWASTPDAETTILVEKARGASLNGEMVCQLGPHIVSMMKGETTPLELMVQDNLLNRYYAHGLHWDRSNLQIGTLVKHFGHKHPRAKILEIGAGTGSATEAILQNLGTFDSGWGPLAASYDFTDVSEGFFEAAQEKLAAWKGLVRYKKLNIEQDVSSQGFESGTYDLVVASQVLHATKSVEKTMSNVRKLLKPGGRLLIIETTQDPLDLQFVFGLLPGWWLSEEEERKLSPSLSLDGWNRVLQETGFSGVETEVHDCEDEELYAFSLMSSMAIEPAACPRRKTNADVVLVLADDDNGAPIPPPSWIDELGYAISCVIGDRPAVQQLRDLDARGKICVYLGDIKTSILRRPSAAQFGAVKKLCTQSRGLLWLTIGAAMNSEVVESTLSTGFLRAIRSEYGGNKNLVSLDLDPAVDLASTGSIRTVVRVVERQLLSTDGDTGNRDYEFAERDEVIHVLRYFKDVERNRTVFPGQVVPTMEPFFQPGRTLKLCIRTPGLLDTLAFEDDAIASTDLGAEELEIEPKAFGVNFRDIMVAMGQLDREKTMCFECAGVVVRAGPDATAQGFRPGDRIMTLLLRGSYATLVRAPWTNSAHIPDKLSFEVAATLPMAFATAHISLFETARLMKDESILIHAATGGVGQAAIMLAKDMGVRIFATVGSEQKRDLLVETYGIPPDRIFSSRDLSFVNGVLAQTNGIGVDMVLNSLAGPLLQGSFDCLARFGRFVEIGKRDLKLNNSLRMGTFSRSASFIHVDLLQLEEFKGFLIQRTMKEIVHLLHEGRITPVGPTNVYPLSELETALRLMQAGKHLGKMVISMESDGQQLVPVLPRRMSAKFRADASYLVVGGLGGIGRSICRWMADRGAKNLIVLSRSADAAKNAAPFVNELGRLGCSIHAVACDISQGDQLANSLQECQAVMPAIRGMIQGAMVLQDSLVEKMTLQDYETAVRPKVEGSWNLHQAAADLGLELDFFIMLSSLAAILGQPGQSNYAAGGTYQDGLARHRNSHGLPGVSIDLGVVLSVGYVAEHDGTAEAMVRSGHTLLSEEDVLKTVESAVIQPYSSQIMLGLNTEQGPHWTGTAMGYDMRFAPLRNHVLHDAESPGKATTASDIDDKIAQATTFQEAAEAVIEGISQKLMSIFMMPETEIDIGKGLVEHGVDSLVAVELRNMLVLRAGAEVSIFDIMQSSSITSLGSLVAARSSHLEASLLPAA